MPGIMDAIVDGIETTEAAIQYPQTQEAIEAEKKRWTLGKSEEDNRYSHFQGCVGAADGTLIPIVLREDDWTPHAHRSHKASFTCMNVLACAGARRNVQYLMIGAEGCAHDAALVSRSRVISLLPPDCYILFDMAMGLINRKVLTPYKGKSIYLI